jgi:short-subunit dehydrogenase
MKELDFYTGKRIWLTGASSGIGEALVWRLHALGAELIVTARRTEVLQQLVTTLGDERVHAFAGDVTDPLAMKDVVHEVERTLGPIDIAIPNAGSHIFTVPERFNSAEYLGLMELNFGGMLHCIEAVLPSMLERGRGVIAPVASLAGYRGLPRAGAYGASKAAMINFLESIRFHLEPKGLKIVIINPGFVKTPLTDKNDFRMPFLVSAEESARYISKGIMKGKREVAFPYLFSRLLKVGRMLPAPLYERIVNLCW